MNSSIQKRFPILLLLSIFMGLQSCDSPKEPRKPKIAIAGLAIESSTFSPAKTEAEAFLARIGEDVFKYYPFLSKESPQRQIAEWVPTLRGHSLPGGIVTRKAYDSLVGITLNMLKEKMPYDGLFFDIHGAMSVEGIDDPEGILSLKLEP